MGEKPRSNLVMKGLVKEKDRPLQGQSPYIVNAGLYYTSSEKIGLSASLLYNIIGKRIVGVGKSTPLSMETAIMMSLTHTRCPVMSLT